MVSVKHDTDGKVIAYAEYFIVNGNGTLNPDGTYCYVNDLWIHTSLRHKRIVRKFLNEEISKWPLLKRVYWKRKKYNDRIKEFDTSKLIKET